MAGLLSWLLSPAGRAIGIVVAGLLFGAVIYSSGKYVGRQQATIERLQGDVAAEAKRRGIDHEVDSLDRYRICLDLGGLRDDCEQLRRLAATAEGE